MNQTVIPQYVNACNVDFTARGLVAIQRPETMPWGPREMCVTDPNGNRLRFAS